MLNRRQAIQKTALAGAAAATGAAMSPLFAQTPPAAPAGFVLPKLPYAYEALEPYIDAQTMQIHHDKHHAAYVANLNKALAGRADLLAKPIEDLITNLDALPEGLRTPVRNQGGGHANHSLLWQMMKPGGGKPSDQMSAAIDKTFGSFSQFKEKFTEAAAKQFGSGWAWLTLDAGKSLAVTSSPNQDSPLSTGQFPLLGIDVWEHAYYLKYQNRRADYIAAFYNVINWDFVSERYAQHKA